MINYEKEILDFMKHFNCSYERAEGMIDPKKFMFRNFGETDEEYRKRLLTK